MEQSINNFVIDFEQRRSDDNFKHFVKILEIFSVSQGLDEPIGGIIVWEIGQITMMREYFQNLFGLVSNLDGFQDK